MGLEALKLEFREKLGEYFAWGSKTSGNLRAVNSKLRLQWDERSYIDGIIDDFENIESHYRPKSYFQQKISDANSEVATPAKGHAILARIPDLLCKKAQCNHMDEFVTLPVLIDLLDTSRKDLSKRQRYLLTEKISLALQSEHVRSDIHDFRYSRHYQCGYKELGTFADEQIHTLFKRYSESVEALFNNISLEDVQSTLEGDARTNRHWSPPDTSALENAKGKKISADVALLASAIFLIQKDQDRLAYFRKLSDVSHSINSEATADLLCSLPRKPSKLFYKTARPD